MDNLRQTAAKGDISAKDIDNWHRSRLPTDCQCWPENVNHNVVIREMAGTLAHLVITQLWLRFLTDRYVCLSKSSPHLRLGSGNWPIGRWGDCMQNSRKNEQTRYIIHKQNFSPLSFLLCCNEMKIAVGETRKKEKRIFLPSAAGICIPLLKGICLFVCSLAFWVLSTKSGLFLPMGYRSRCRDDDRSTTLGWTGKKEVKERSKKQSCWLQFWVSKESLWCLMRWLRAL